MSIPEHLSYSQITDVLSCGEKYRLARKYEAPKNPACYLIGGSVVHAVTDMVDVGWPELDITGDEIQELCRKDFAREIAAASEVQPDQSLWGVGGRGKTETIEWWQEEAPRMVGRWVDFRRDSNLTVATLSNGMVAAEVEFTIQYGGKAFRGGIDRLMVGKATDEKAIVDLKTGARVPTSPYQLAFYRDAMLMLHGVNVRWGYYWMARSGKLSQPFDLDRIPYALTSDMAVKAKKIIEQELFIPNPGMFCGTCEVRQYCSAMGGDPTPLIGAYSATD